MATCTSSLQKPQAGDSQDVLTAWTSQNWWALGSARDLASPKKVENDWGKYTHEHTCMSTYMWTCITHTTETCKQVHIINNFIYETRVCAFSKQFVFFKTFQTPSKPELHCLVPSLLPLGLSDFHRLSLIPGHLLIHWKKYSLREDQEWVNSHGWG